MLGTTYVLYTISWGKELKIMSIFHKALYFKNETDKFNPRFFFVFFGHMF